MLIWSRLSWIDSGTMSSTPVRYLRSDGNAENRSESQAKSRKPPDAWAQ
ncbi:hypothetical protein T02_7436 [Trichinella nativa]|uniref:Uncharacterized protein n=1 Tax=Trichinella nativa TaxID=6335 RepID=A0A0V1L1T0_9BILA|nr:hypothetical protein T02_7436 [Trichinella nativa]